MSQHDYNIANASFPSVRTDINNVLSAINTSNSGSSRPSGAVEGTIWLDTSGAATAQLLKMYDGADDILLGTINFTANTIDWADSASEVSLAGVETLTNKTLTSPKINEDVVVTSTATELNKLDALSRGSILYGNASAVTSILTTGTVGQLLTSDGTDIAWQDAAASGLEWQTIITGSTLTAVAGRAYWINTTSNTCTITLPSSASNGDQIILADYARTWGTNKIIIDSNGLNYQGNADSYTVEYSTSGETVNIVYSGATNGWIPLDDDSVADVGVAPATQKAIFAFGSVNGGARTGISNLVNSSGVVASDTSAIGTASEARMAATYGGDKAIFAFGNGSGSAKVSFSNLVNNSGVIATDTTGVGMARGYVGGTEYGGDKALAAFGTASDADGGQTSISNKISNSGVVASNTTGVGLVRAYLAGVRFGVGKGIFGFGQAAGVGITGVTNLVSDTGTVATDTSAVGTACEYVGAAAYGGDKGVFGFGRLAGGRTAKTNKVSNTGVVASDTSGVGTVRQYVSGTNYGADKGIFGFGSTADGNTNGTGITNLVNTSGVVASDTTAVGTARWYTTGAGYSFSA